MAAEILTTEGYRAANTGGLKHWSPQVGLLPGNCHPTKKLEFPPAMLGPGRVSARRQKDCTRMSSGGTAVLPGAPRTRRMDKPGQPH
jgi:hypothetical protein